MQDYDDNVPPQQGEPQPAPQPEQPPRHVTDPGQMPQPPRYGHSGYYQQPPQQAAPPATEEPMTLGDWMVTILISSLPIVNIIMLFVWAFGGQAKINKSNWAKASLLWVAIWVVIHILMMTLFFAVAINSGENLFDW